MKQKSPPPRRRSLGASFGRPAALGPAAGGVQTPRGARPEDAGLVGRTQEDVAEGGLESRIWSLL